MTPNPNCPGVPHRPECPHYRRAVERHFELGGKTHTKRNGEPVWHLIHGSNWNWAGYEYRPAEPLHTDSHPNGLPDPGDGWRWLMVGEELSADDKFRVPPILGDPEQWIQVPAEFFGMKHDEHGYHFVRRRIASEQDGLTDDDLNQIVDRQKQMESIVRRLAAIDMADYWTWRCVAASLINEAREVCDD